MRNAVIWRAKRGNIRHRIIRCFDPRSSSWLRMVFPMRRSAHGCPCPDRSSASGANAFLISEVPGSTTNLAPGGRPVFPPEVIVQIKAMACELPATSKLPLSRFSREDLAREAVNRGIVARISGTTIWRWLDADAIRPWQHRRWIFPRDPDFAEKAGRVLDLYQGYWQGEALASDEFVISADEKTSIQARLRLRSSLPPKKGAAMRVEFEYERGGALAYLAAWDVRQARIFGQCAATTGIAPFDALVGDVMRRSPYRDAKRVFWIVDNCSSHRGAASCRRLQGKFPNLVLIHLPVHASWLNQIEIYFSIVQRKVLSPNDFTALDAVIDRLNSFQTRYNQTARPFKWFTTTDLNNLLTKLDTHEPDEPSPVLCALPLLGRMARCRSGTTRTPRSGLCGWSASTATTTTASGRR